MIGIIVIIYSLYPEKLIRSIEAHSRHRIRWYFYFHGRDQQLLLRSLTLAHSTNARVFPYRANRGVAKSWNDGLLLSRREGNDVTMLINDDTFFYPGCFDDFIGFVRYQRTKAPNFALCTPCGFEAEGAYKGEMEHMHCACCAVGPAALARVGFFDENFQPAYWEDTDYIRRIRLAGLPVLGDHRILIEHERGQTVRNNPNVAQRIKDANRENNDYWLRKWGGAPHQEQFERPFNDDSFDCLIPEERRRNPYGAKFDRDLFGRFPQDVTW